MNHILVLNNTILNPKTLNGGDLIFPQMAKQFKNKCDIHLIGTISAKKIWLNIGIKSKFHIYKDILFCSETLLFGPIIYCLRTIQSLFILLKLVKKLKNSVIIYTPSDLYPDVIPAFICRMFFPKIRWVGRIYYINESPIKRQGNFFYTFFSFLSQRIGLFLMKKKCDQVIILNSSYNDVKTYGFSSDKMFRTHTGVDQSEANKIPEVKKIYDAIFIGSIGISRGAYEALYIWKKVISKEKSAILAIAGGGNKKIVKKYLEIIQKLGLSKNIKFLGFVKNQKDLFYAIKSSKLFLSTRLEGGWDMPTLEAASLRTPGIVYQMNRNARPLQKSIEVVPLGNQDIFSKKIITLLRNKTKRDTMAKFAQNEIKKYDWKIISRDFENHMSTDL